MKSKLQKRRPPVASMLALAAAFTTLSNAHSMYQSDLLLDFSGSDVHAELQLPLERMSVAFGHPINERTFHGDRSALGDYILDRFHARTTEGKAFRVSLEAPLKITIVDGAPYLVAHMRLQAPVHTRTESFDMADDVILDCISSQVALVTVRSDWRHSVFANDPQLVGVLRSSSRWIRIDRSGGSWFSGFGSIFHLGLRHIAEGTDHLLFLLALLLPAPLLASHSRWVGSTAVRQSVLRILKVVTAFTVGHSVTLALAALGLVHVPGRPIEVLIAVSILISALHTLRPLFPGQEPVIAAFFGLVHGLAFATTLGELGLSRWDRVASIFGFNLGIETMQLIVVAATMPSLLLFSRVYAYSAVRIGGALFAALASLGWIAERLLNLHTPVDAAVDTVAHQAVWLAPLLFAVSAMFWLIERKPLTMRSRIPAQPGLERI